LLYFWTFLWLIDLTLYFRLIIIFLLNFVESDRTEIDVFALKINICLHIHTFSFFYLLQLSVILKNNLRNTFIVLRVRFLWHWMRLIKFLRIYLSVGWCWKQYFGAEFMLLDSFVIIEFNSEIAQSQIFLFNLQIRAYLLFEIFDFTVIGDFIFKRLAFYNQLQAYWSRVVLLILIFWGLDYMYYWICRNPDILNQVL
jgi:hypothetical protein